MSQKNEDDLDREIREAKKAYNEAREAYAYMIGRAEANSPRLQLLKSKEMQAYNHLNKLIDRKQGI